MTSCAILLGLALSQIVNPLPRGTSAYTGNTGEDIQGERKSDNHGLRPSFPPAIPAEADVAQVHRQQKASENAEDSVQLTSLPPITIADKQKGLLDHVFDWGPWVCNLFLVIVGFLQVKLLRQTREEMSRQARDAREQQRAKLEVLFPPNRPEFVPFTKDNENRMAIHGIDLRVTNYGYTEAFKVVAKGHLLVGKDPRVAFAPTNRLNFPSVINRMANPQTAETTDSVPVKLAPEGYVSSVPQNEHDQILNKHSHLRVAGVVEYVDVYGTTRESPFDFLWVVQEVVEKGMKVDKSFWLNQSRKTT